MTMPCNIGLGHLRLIRSRFGEGPLDNWKVAKYEPYFSPKSADLVILKHTSSQFQINDLGNSFVFPTLKDAWDTPIMFFRSVRELLVQSFD